MRTAVDSSVLFDLLLADAQFGVGAREALDRAGMAGSLVVSPPVWAETRAYFPDSAGHTRQMLDLQLDYDALTSASASRAGALWREFRKRGGGQRRVIADFLIGAHAASQADALLTRDRGFFRAYFKGLKLIEP